MSFRNAILVFLAGGAVGASLIALVANQATPQLNKASVLESPNESGNNGAATAPQSAMPANDASSVATRDESTEGTTLRDESLGNERDSALTENLNDVASANGEEEGPTQIVDASPLGGYRQRERLFLGEDIDYAWAPAIEQTISDSYSSDPVSLSFELRSIECRSTKCRVVVAAHDEATSAMWPQLAHSIGSSLTEERTQTGTTFYNIDGRSVIVHEMVWPDRDSGDPGS